MGAVKVQCHMGLSRDALSAEKRWKTLRFEMDVSSSW